MADYLTTRDGRIQIHPGHILIPGNTKLGTQNQTIREQTLASYSEFLTNWNIAMAQCYADPSVSFASLWVYNEAFREHLTLALQAVGLDRPQDLKPCQLSELVLLCHTDNDEQGDNRGAVFRLHQDVPDPKTPTPQQEGEMKKAPDSATLSPWNTFRQWF